MWSEVINTNLFGSGLSRLCSSNVKRLSISLFILLFINALFIIKYSERLGISTLVGLSGCLIIWALVYQSYRILKIIELALSRDAIPFFIGLLVLILLIITQVLLTYLPITELNVDRISVISSFWESAFSGEYPYFASSHMGNKPGPFPFYFVLVLPFNLIGELGYISVCSVFLFAVVLYLHRASFKTIFITTILVLTFPPIMWEIVGRSTIFFNSVLVVFLMTLHHRRRLTDWNEILLYGLLFGLLISTRSIYIIPYCLYFIYLFRFKKGNLKNIGALIFVMAFSFIVTFLPLLLLFPKEFFITNPFITQNSLMPFSLSFLFVLIGIFVSKYVKNVNDLFYYSGLVLFGLIVTYAGYIFGRFGFIQGFHNSTLDISYFIFCIPFLMTSVVLDLKILNA